MILTVSIAGATALLMILSVLTKPYAFIKKHKVAVYVVVCLVGAIFMLLLKRISFSDALKGITANTAVNPLKILVLFISMSLISIYLGDAGFFDYCANKIFCSSKGSAYKVFVILYVVVAILTVFTSNDIIILTFTPPICIFSKKAKISPIPFLIAEFVAANTWSMMLIVGNPTNIYLAGSFGITFFEYFKSMFIPALFGGLFGFFALILLFNKTLKNSKIERQEEREDGTIKIEKVPLIASLIALISCIILLAVSDLIGFEMWAICLFFFLALTVFNIVYGLIKNKNLNRVFRVLRKAPYELIPFVLSMFIIVLSLSSCGFTDKLSTLLITGNKTDGLTVGFISAISSNLLNNIPMSVLFEKIASTPIAVYGAVIGSNIGAFITPVGALAGIMWGKILKDYDVKLSFFKFSAYGITVAFFSLLFSLLALVFI